MKLNDRLEFIDQCVAGEKARFKELLSIRYFNSLDRGYELYRDYVRQKNKISDVSCDVTEDSVIIHFKTPISMDDLLSENLPKKGITPVVTESGVDLNIKLIDQVL